MDEGDKFVVNISDVASFRAALTAVALDGKINHLFTSGAKRGRMTFSLNSDTLPKKSQHISDIRLSRPSTFNRCNS